MGKIGPITSSSAVAVAAGVALRNGFPWWALAILVVLAICAWLAVQLAHELMPQESEHRLNLLQSRSQSKRPKRANHKKHDQQP